MHMFEKRTCSTFPFGRYDVNGREGVNNTNFMDGVEFFGMIFGCDQFEYLIGELFLATTARAGGDMFDPVSETLLLKF